MGNAYYKEWILTGMDLQRGWKKVCARVFVCLALPMDRNRADGGAWPDLIDSTRPLAHACTHPLHTNEQIPPGELALKAAGETWDKMYKKTRSMCLHEARDTVRLVATGWIRRAACLDASLRVLRSVFVGGLPFDQPFKKKKKKTYHPLSLSHRIVPLECALDAVRQRAHGAADRGLRLLAQPQ